MRKSIGLKLFATMMTLVLVMILLLWFFQIIFLDRFYLSLQMNELTKKSNTIITRLEQLSSLDEINNNDEIIDELNSFSNSRNLSIALLDNRGNTFYQSLTGYEQQAPMMLNRYKNEFFNQIEQGQQIRTTITHPRFSNEFMLIGLPIKINNEVSGALFLTMPIAQVQDTVDILSRQLLYITIILLIIAILLAFVLSRNFTKPILEIERVARKMSYGDLSVRVKSKRNDEIGQLALTINDMGKELSKTEQLRKDLIANVSHELRTPLSLIKGYAETIKDVTGDIKEKRDRQLGIIIDESDRLSLLVNEILSLSRLQAGSIPMEFSAFEIGKTIEQMKKRFEGICESLSIDLHTEVISNLFVVGDEQHIEQVLYNFINNAINHTGEGGRISISMSDLEKTVKIEVSDTGTGIPEEALKHIWDRFYKVESSKRKKGIGTGLGLAIVKSILDAHKVPYGVISSEGKGTTFWFELGKNI